MAASRIPWLRTARDRRPAIVAAAGAVFMKGAGCHGRRPCRLRANGAVRFPTNEAISDVMDKKRKMKARVSTICAAPAEISPNSSTAAKIAAKKKAAAQPNMQTSCCRPGRHHRHKSAPVDWFPIACGAKKPFDPRDRCSSNFGDDALSPNGRGPIVILNRSGSRALCSSLGFSEDRKIDPGIRLDRRAKRLRNGTPDTRPGGGQQCVWKPPGWLPGPLASLLHPPHRSPTALACLNLPRCPGPLARSVQCLGEALSRCPQFTSCATEARA